MNLNFACLKLSLNGSNAMVSEVTLRNLIISLHLTTQFLFLCPVLLDPGKSIPLQNCLHSQLLGNLSSTAEIQNLTNIESRQSFC